MRRNIFSLHMKWFFLIVLIAGLSFSAIAQADPIDPNATSSSSLQYTLLEQIPFTSGTNLTLPQYLKALYNFTFWAVGIAALFMLSVGGFLYLTSAGNTSTMGTAKSIIYDSLLGLALALVAWLFLYVINPDLIKMTLPSVTPTTPSVGGGTTPPPGGGTIPPTSAYLTDSEARQKLSNAGISVNASEPQTSLNQIPSSALDRLILMKQRSSCDITVTGGTESGHQTHGPKLPVLDVRNTSCLDNYIAQNRFTFRSTFGISKFCVTNTNPYLMQQGVATCLENNNQAHYHFAF